MLATVSLGRGFMAKKLLLIALVLLIVVGAMAYTLGVFSPS